MTFSCIKNKLSGFVKSDMQDMTKGNPFRLIFCFSLPILFGNLFQQLYSMVDMMIVGRLLGKEALAAVGSTGSMTFLILGFVFGLTSGFAVITAQSFGTKDSELLKRSVAMNITLNAFAAVFFTVFATVTSYPILKIVNTPTEIIHSAYIYLAVIYLGIGATVLYNASSCILRAVGDSRTPFYFLVFSSILNVILDYILVKYTPLNVAGAALATVISQLVAGLLSMMVIIKKYPSMRLKKSHFTFNLPFAWHHLKIGLPMAFQFSITAIGTIILQRALNAFGTNTIAGYSAAIRVEQLICIASTSFGVVMANYTGQNYGAHSVERIKSGTVQGSLLTLIFAVISMIISLCFPQQLVSLFIEKGSANYDEVLNAARTYLVRTAPFYPILFMIFIYRNVLQSIGKNFMPVMGGVFELIARTVVAFILPAFIGYLGICYAGPIAWVSAALPLGIAYFYIIKRLKI